MAVPRRSLRSAAGDWPSFGRDAGAQRYSPLTQINKQNVGRLQQAWSFDTGARDLQVTPLVINGVMYLTGRLHCFCAHAGIRRCEVEI